MTDRNRMLDGMMGLVAGDALGCPVQFLSREQIKNRGPMTGMEGHGAYDMPAGTWTDDSSMALCELASINDKNKIDLDDIMERFADWKMNGAYTPFGAAFDEGITCSEAIYKYRKYRDVKTCGRTGEHANGNGALMRILPVCLFYIRLKDRMCISDEETIQSIHEVTALTHNHLRSYIASGLYYFMAKAIIYNTANIPLKECLQKGLDDGFKFYRQNSDNSAELMHYVSLFDINEFACVSADDICGSGYVVDSLEAAVWCLITTDTFKECLLKAVNLGDDTDTVAAIAGGLAGLFYGYENIPEEWLAVIQRREWIEDMCK